MTDIEALYAAVMADPADDTARLVWADCAEENGQPDRAEFVRVQVELSKFGWGERRHAPQGEPIALGALGGRHYEMDAYPDDGFRVGERFDMFVYRPGKKPKWRYGFKVVSVKEVHPELNNRGELDVVIRLDDESDRWAALRRREETLFGCDGFAIPLGGLLVTHQLPGEFTQSWLPLAVCRRGFVDEIRLSQECFMSGPECRRCAGTGHTNYEWGNDWTCSPCHGSGRNWETNPFRSHPVTRVTFTDKIPSEWSAGENGDQREWVWERNMRDVPSSGPWDYLGPGPFNPNADRMSPVIDPELFDRLSGSVGGRYFAVGKISHRRYPSRGAAVDDLSRVAVSVARERAGLPPFDFKPIGSEVTV